MYMGYVEYNLIYRQWSLKPETFSETKTFNDIAQLMMLIGTSYIEKLCDLYGADEVQIVGVYTKGKEMENLEGRVG